MHPQPPSKPLNPARFAGVASGRRWPSWVLVVVAWALMFSAPLPALAQTPAAYFDLLKARLVQDGFDQTRIETLFSQPQISFDARAVTLFLAHREASLNYDQFISPDSILSARQYMLVHQAALDQSQKTYGVDKEVITAILLVETRLGTFLGGPSTVNTLSSLAALADPQVRSLLWQQVESDPAVSQQQFERWANKKSQWAYGELKALLTYTDSQQIDPLIISGSYAGALGIAQFVPSSILAFGRDGDNDGRVDLFNHADAIASIASYLKHHGWRSGISLQEAQKVVYHYNRSSYYVDTVLKISELLKG